ncbi:MAG: peptidoglycan DD-metalloendopeptidase family protein [Candidatus Doudnabacteria bacterium]|nr:peptidoglycan DD-metalloendopeptidase family protein [Candidatus Doudnabacteria bacterium]
MVKYTCMISNLKRKHTSNKKILSLSLLVAVVFFVAYSKPPVLGQAADDLAKQKQEKQKQLDSINQRIGELSQQITQRKAMSRTLNNEIAILNLQIAQTEAQLEETQAKIDSTNLEIADVTNNIVKAEQDIAKNKEVLKRLISQINDLDQMSPLEIALENDNFAEFLNQLQYTTNIQEQSQESLNQIKILRAELEQRQAELKKFKADLDALSEELELTQAGLDGQRIAKQQILDQTKSQERAYQVLLSQSENLENQVEKEIYDLDAQISAKLGNRKLPPKKGLFMWPMEGTLTQGYGNTGFTSLGYNYHNGVDIAAPAGRQIYVAFDGVVQDTGVGQGAYGNWVTIRHTVTGGRQLITLYAHMSSYKVAKGQQVKAGDLVGFEGNTGNTTRLLYGPHRGYHLHFTVFDAEGYGVSKGTLVKQFGSYYVPYGATYNPMDFL